MTSSDDGHDSTPMVRTRSIRFPRASELCLLNSGRVVNFDVPVRMSTDRVNPVILFDTLDSSFELSRRRHRSGIPRANEKEQNDGSRQVVSITGESPRKLSLYSVNVRVFSL